MNKSNQEKFTSSAVHDKQVLALKSAIQKGIDSGRVKDFDPAKFLAHLKQERSSKNKLT